MAGCWGIGTLNTWERRPGSKAIAKSGFFPERDFRFRIGRRQSLPPYPTALALNVLCGPFLSRPLNFFVSLSEGGRSRGRSLASSGSLLPSTVTNARPPQDCQELMDLKRQPEI